MNLLNELCMLNGTSGDEKSVRDFIISKLPQDCTYSVDALGNLIVEKKGETTPKNKVALFAHMDEVGFIVTYISDDGHVYVSNVGGIDDSALFGKKITINGCVGVAGAKAIHQCSGDEAKKIPEINSVSVDFGFESREDAEKYIVDFFEKLKWQEEDVVKIRIQNMAKEIVYNKLMENGDKEKNIKKEDVESVLHSLKVNKGMKRQIGFVMEGAEI